jgi:hypothetical protein
MGEFYRALTDKELKKEDDGSADVTMIFEVEPGLPFPKIVFLVRV